MNGNSPNGQEYFRSLDHLADTPEFREWMHREFPAGAADMLTSEQRRSFLKVMGASLALAGFGLTGCRRWPEQEIAPYSNRPDDHVPGKSQYFATSMELGGVASGLLVTAYDYRPVKIEGNPDHPVNRGATSVFDQAAILDLYDPDRSRYVLQRNEDGELSRSSRDAFFEWLGVKMQMHRNNGGAGLAVLAEASDSPSRKAMKQQLLSTLPQASWHEYEPINNDNELRGSEFAFGEHYRPQYTLDDAKVIVSLGSDFLGNCGPAISVARSFARSRRPEDEQGGPRDISRLYCFESNLSLTGSRADERVAVRSSDVPAIAAAIAARLNVGGEGSNRSSAGLSEQVMQMIDFVVEDLQNARGNSAIIAGKDQPAEVHYLAHLLNEALGNLGNTVSYLPTPDAQPHVQSLRELVQKMNDQQVQTLVIIGGNPVYNAPADVQFADALANVGDAVHLSAYVDETSMSQPVRWHVNRAHFLEAWSDGQAYDGTYTLAQPLIQPLFDGLSPLELLAAMIGEGPRDGRAIVQRTCRDMLGGNATEKQWRKAIHDGFVADVGPTPTADLQVQQGGDASEALRSLLERGESGGDGEIEITFTPDATVYDGRFANNGWLQELPDPLTKITWDNAVIVGVEFAQRMELERGDMVRLTVGDRAVEAPVYTLPGHSNDSVTVALGYGRSMNTMISRDAGFDFYPLRTSDRMGFTTGRVEKIAGEYPLATTQDHHTIDVATVGGSSIQNRLPTIVRAAEIDEYREHPNFAKHRAHAPHTLSLFQEDMPFHEDADGREARYAWGMTIDLNTCTGCSACIVACQAENNIPIVGKNQVLMGREMHWLRLDRYFRFGKRNGKPSAELFQGVALQPMMCVHCENAPCEQVCPVAATVHDEDGLNVMVYNRCIGTRYCSNNCPYKVRRFNYFDYHRRAPHRKQPGKLLQVEPEYYTRSQADPGPLRKMQMNPEVTVRVRGVMEKCTYCLQRIAKAKIDAKNQWVRLPQGHPDRQEREKIEDGTVQTACQQACPTGAIVFGDLMDSDSRVAQGHRNPRSYELLKELNTKPRTRYLAQLWNHKGPRPDAYQAGGHGHNGASHEDDNH